MVSAVGRRATAVAVVALAAAATFVCSAPAAPAAPVAAASPVAGVPPGYRPLTVKTLPPLAGVRFQLNATQLVTGPDGTVRTLLTKADRDALVTDRNAHLHMITQNIDVGPGVRARFHGWYQAGYQFTPQNPVGQIELATFDLDSQTGFTFVDRHHAALDARDITDMQLRNSLGGLVDIGKPKTVWLRSAIVTSVAGEVTLKNVDWRLAQVMFHDTNIVQRGSQHFRPRESRSVAIRVNLFTVEFHAEDAFFGSPKGTSIRLTLPDGTVRTVALRDGRATVEQLPSGDYDVRVDASGLGKEQSVSVSHDATIELKVLGLVDVALVLVVVLVLVCGVLLLGWRARRRRRAAIPSDPAPDAVPA